MERIMDPISAKTLRGTIMVARGSVNIMVSAAERWEK